MLSLAETDKHNIMLLTNNVSFKMNNALYNFYLSDISVVFNRRYCRNLRIFSTKFKYFCFLTKYFL